MADRYIIVFFIYAFLGYVSEVIFCSVPQRRFVNRGFLYGPWLPIYGVGGVLVVVLLKRFVDRPLMLFFMTMAVCGVVEYTAGYLLWEMKHMYWWNYSGYFLNQVASVR